MKGGKDLHESCQHSFLIYFHVYPSKGCVFPCFKVCVAVHFSTYSGPETCFFLTKVCSYKEDCITSWTESEKYEK